MGWVARIRNLGRRGRVDAEIEAELRAHLEMAAEDGVRMGMSEDEARRAARMRFGNPVVMKERTVGADAALGLESLGRDVRYALRQFARNPGFAAIAIATLALGIGTTTAVFGIVNGLLFRSLGIREESHVVMAGFRQRGQSWQQGMSLPEYEAIRQQAQRVFTGVLAENYSLDGMSVQGHQPDRVFTDYVTGNYFEVLGVRPLLGRLFRPGEGVTPGADPEVVLSYSYWKEHFAGDRGIVGRQVAVNDHPMTVIGVTPRSFHGLNSLFKLQVYLPMAMVVPVENTPVAEYKSESNRDLFVFARLRPGVTRQRVNAALALVARHLAAEHPRTDPGAEIRSFSLSAERMGGFDPNNNLDAALGLFLGLAGVVLLLACVNVGNLVLVRAGVRQREMAMRAALGARPARLARQMVTESLLLGLAGGAGGLALGLWGSSLLSNMNLETDLPLQLNFGLDWHVLAFAAAIAVTAGALVGLAPALRLKRTDLNVVLREGGRGMAGGRSRPRDGLVAAEVRAALVLLILAGLFTRSLERTAHRSLGFNPKHVATAMMDPSEIGYNDAQARDFYRTLLARVRALPGVQSATTSIGIPFGLVNSPGDGVMIPGRTLPPGQQPPTIGYEAVGGQYFRTLQIPLLEGRHFAASDDAKSPRVAIVSAAMARKFWPREDAIGKTFAMSSDAGHPLRVVGVAGDAWYANLGDSVAPFFYLPFAQHDQGDSMETLEVRTQGDPKAMIPVLERTIHAMAPELPVFEVKTLHESLYSPNGLLMYEVIAGLAGALGGLGLVLAIVGVYGVLSYVVQQKTSEIGVRIALGAQRRDIFRVVYRQGLWIVGSGLAAGVVLSLVLAHLVRSMLEVSAVDPVTYLGVSAILAGVAFLACSLPARRAAGVDPMVALRSE